MFYKKPSLHNITLIMVARGRANCSDHCGMAIQYCIVAVAVSIMVSVSLASNERYSLVRVYKAGATTQDKVCDDSPLATASDTSFSIAFRASSGVALDNSCTIFSLV